MAEALKMKVDIDDKEAVENYNLPDARDGLTPRQRRILWAMYLRKLSSRSDYGWEMLSYQSYRPL